MDSYSVSDRCRISRISLMSSKAYLIELHSDRYLVDTGMPGDYPILSRELKKRLQGSPLQAILLTHSHKDHVGNADRLSAEYSCPVYASSYSLDILRRGESRIPPGINRAGRVKEWLMRLSLRSPRTAGFRPLQNLHPVNELILPDGLSVMPTPGHSRDSLSFILEGKIACTGDLIIRRRNAPGQDLLEAPDRQRESIQQLLRSGVVLMLPGHAHPVTREDLEGFI